MKKFLLFPLFLWCFSSLAQFEQPLVSEGTIPNDFIQPTLEKIAQENKKSDANNPTEFNAQIFFSIDRILQSGQVVFNDTISRYVTKVYNEICKHNPDVPTDVRIYTVNSDITNAFTTQQGIIFVNVGLLARLDNEAQLAFVLCHELIHYMKSHVMQGYESDQELHTNNLDYRTVKTVDNQVASTRFSRKMETEADKLGIELFLRTNYNPQQIEKVFNVLLYSYLPFSSVPFDSTIVMGPDYKIPATYFKTELDEVDAEEDVEDFKHSHPNVAKRKKLAQHILTDSIVAEQDFVHSKAEFEYIKLRSQFEIVQIQVRNTRYSRVIYNGSVLAQKDSNTIATAINKALYGSAVMANTKSRKKVTGYYKYQQGPVQQAYYMMSKIKSKDLTFLAARNTWDYLQQQPQDTIVQRQFITLLSDLIYYYNLEMDELTFTPDSVAIADSSLWNYTLFESCQCETEFQTYYDKALAVSDRKKIENATTDDVEKNEELEKKNEEARKKELKNGVALNIDNIVLIDPNFTGVDISEEVSDKIQVTLSETTRQDFLKNAKRIGEAENLAITPLSVYTMHPDQVDQFNDLALLSAWFDERFVMRDRTNVISTSAQAQELVKKYGTPYFAWSGVMWTTAPKELNYSYFVVFNLATGELLMYQENDKKGKINNEQVEKIYTDFFHQVSRSEI